MEFLFQKRELFIFNVLLITSLFFALCNAIRQIGRIKKLEFKAMPDSMIEPIKISWSWSRFISTAYDELKKQIDVISNAPWLRGLWVGLFLSIPLLIFLALIDFKGTIKALVNAVVPMIFFPYLLPSLIAFITLAIINGLKAPKEEIESTSAYPNQNIKKSFSSGLTVFSLILIISLITSFLIPQQWLATSRISSFFVTALGLFFALKLGWELGLAASIKHCILRLILYRNGYIPWNYAHFLDYAAERIFLQKVGGGYIFIHRLLLEHFAQMELDELRR